MIILWDVGIPSALMAQYGHLWTRAGEKAGEEVCILPYTPQNERREVKRVNYYHGKRVIFVRPELIPFPSFFEELDYYRAEDQLVVAVKKYNATFKQKQEIPVKWEENGVSNTLLVFQVAGQKEFTVPENEDIWEWLEKKNRSWVYKIDSSFAGDRYSGISMRNILGSIIYSPFGTGSKKAYGKLITGEQRYTSRAKQSALWRAGLEGWSIWESQ